MNRSPTNLINILIGKSILETVLVGAMAVGFYIKAFPPYFHGWGEATSHSISGWAVNNRAPFDRVQVHLFIDGNFIGTLAANLSRPDVRAAGWSQDEWHGFSFNAPPLSAGLHEARVYALQGSAGGARYTLQLLGDPIRFVVATDGSLTDISKNVASVRGPQRGSVTSPAEHLGWGAIPTGVEAGKY